MIKNNLKDVFSDVEKCLFKNMVFSFILGDTLGVPHEFKSRKSFHITELDLLNNPPKHVRFPFHVWSDDTSMMLANFDTKPYDLYQLMNNFLAFYQKGAYTTYNSGIFDIGLTIQNALNEYKRNHNLSSCGVTGDFACGNGALMRILAIFPLFKKLPSIEEKFQLIQQYSVITHNHLRIFIANYFYLRFIELLFDKFNQEQEQNQHFIENGFYIHSVQKIYDEIKNFANSLESDFTFKNLNSNLVQNQVQDFELNLNDELNNYFGLNSSSISLNHISSSKEMKNFLNLFSKDTFLKELKHFDRLLNIHQLSEDDIKSTGYVIDTLEACFWCLFKSKNFIDSLVLAINLGNDTDTITALTASLSCLKFYLKDFNNFNHFKNSQDLDLNCFKNLNKIDFINFLSDKNLKTFKALKPLNHLNLLSSLFEQKNKHIYSCNFDGNIDLEYVDKLINKWLLQCDCL